jgi:hypothetical protein
MSPLSFSLNLCGFNEPNARVLGRLEEIFHFGGVG